MQNYYISRQKHLPLQRFQRTSMLRNILNTLITKFSSALFGFLTLVLVSRVLGSEGKGEQAIVVYNIYVLLLVFTLIGNSTLVYLTPRKKPSDLLTVSLLWIGILVIALNLLFLCIPSIASPYIFASIWIGGLAAICEVNQFILLGKQQISRANTLKLLYPLISFGYIFVLHLSSRFDGVEDCIYGMALAYLLSLIYGIIRLKEDYRRMTFLSAKELCRIFATLFSLGATKQIGSIAQSLNYRLSFYIMGYYCGTSLVGIYSNGVSLTEAVMLFGTSLALVQYSSLSNNSNDTNSKRLTWQMSGVNALFTFLALLVLCCIPKQAYILLFGEGFGEIRSVIRMLSAGIMLLSISSNFTQYLFSRGNFKISTIASLAGLLATLLLGFLLIPRYGISGAAITATISYTITFAIEFYGFLKWRTK